MKKSTKKILSTSAIFAMILTTLSGCAKSSDEKNTASTGGDKTMSATLKFALPCDEPKGQAEVTKALEDKLAKDGLKFKLDFTFIPADQYWNKISMFVASGESYDLAWSHISNISSFVAKKGLAPLNDSLKNYGQDILKDTPDYSFKEVTFDGQIYAIPRVMPMAESGSFVQIRGDLRKKYGIPEIKTLSDFENYLAAVKKNDPQMTPYFYDPGRFLVREYGDVAFLGGEFLDAPVYIDPADPQLKVKSTYESDIFKNIMLKMRDWSEKGYYEPDYSKIPDAEAALNTGKIAATQSFVLKQTERIDNFKAAMPSGELENVYLNPEKPKYVFSSVDNLMSVLSTSKHVNEAVAFLNWTRKNQDNYDLFSYGIKDTNYKLSNDAVSYEGVAADKSYMPDSWMWNDIKYARFSKFVSNDYATTLKNWDKDAKASPTLGFVLDTAPIKTEMAQLNAVIGEYKPMLYKSNINYDTTMAKFKQKLKDAGIDTVVKEVQKQFDAYKAKNK